MTKTLHENPDYTKEKKDLIRYRDLYEGDHDVLCNESEYLWYLPIERKKPNNNVEQAKITQIRYDRAERTRYLNFPEIIVSLWIALLFRKRYQLDDDAQKTLEGIEDNIDGQNTSFWEFLKTKVAPSLFVYGKVYVLIDSTQDHALNKTEEIAKGLRPYAELLEPLDCKDWQIEATGERAGKYKWFRHEYLITLPRESAEVEPKEVRRSDVLVHNGSRYEIHRYEAKTDEAKTAAKIKDGSGWELKGIIPTDVSDIPLASLVDSTWVHEVCEETLRHFNLRSVKDTIEFTQGFTKMIVKGIDPTSQGQLDAFSNYTVTIIPADADVITISPTPTGDLKLSIDEAVDNIFKVGLNKLRTLPSTSKENESADSQSEDKENIYALAESTVTQIEGIANQILVHIAEFRGDSKKPGKITMSREFDKESITQWLSVYTALQDKLILYPELDKAAFKKAVTSLNLESEVMDKVDEIIEKGGESDPNTERSSILGRFLNGQTDTGREEPDTTERA